MPVIFVGSIFDGIVMMAGLSAMEIEESSLVEEMRRGIDQLFDPSFSNLPNDRNSSYAAADGVIMARCRAYT